LPRNNFIAPAFAALLAVAAAMLPAGSAAQDPDPRLPIMLDADSLEYDGKSSMLMYTGLRLTQGTLGIQADRAHASKPDFEDSVWQFSGNVVIDVQNGHMKSETADLKFSGNQLKLATVTGAPATFEMQRPGTDVVTYAEAGRLQYDFEGGIVEFSENAVIIEGCNQISSNYLVYNIKEQRINAQSPADSDEKVKITYTPRDAVNADACDGRRSDATGTTVEQDDDRP
jgi:lipopolysaccharide transport protein LptA